MPKLSPRLRLPLAALAAFMVTFAVLVARGDDEPAAPDPTAAAAAAGFDPIWVRPGTPVSSAWTMSVRFVSLTPSLNRALSRRATSGFSA